MICNCPCLVVVSWLDRVSSAIVFVLIPMVMMMIITALRFMTLTTWANGIAPAEKQAFSQAAGKDGVCFRKVFAESSHIY